MSKIAVIRTGGKQYKVAEGQTIKIEKIEKTVGETAVFETLLVADGAKLEIGTPSLGEKVTAEVLEQGRADKITVVKYKNKTRYKRTLGHRQPFTAIKVTAIA